MDRVRGDRRSRVYDRIGEARGAGEALTAKLGGGYLARIGGSAAENAGANVHRDCRTWRY